MNGEKSPDLQVIPIIYNEWKSFIMNGRKIRRRKKDEKQKY